MRIKIPNCLARSRCAINTSFLPMGFYVESREMTSSLGKNGCYSLCRWNSDNKHLWETPASPAWHRKQASLPSVSAPNPLPSERSGGAPLAGSFLLCLLIVLLNLLATCAHPKFCEAEFLGSSLEDEDEMEGRTGIHIPNLSQQLMAQSIMGCSGGLLSQVRMSRFSLLPWCPSDTLDH